MMPHAVAQFERLRAPLSHQVGELALAFAKDLRIKPFYFIQRDGFRRLAGFRVAQDRRNQQARNRHAFIVFEHHLMSLVRRVRKKAEPAETTVRQRNSFSSSLLMEDKN